MMTHTSQTGSKGQGIKEPVARPAGQGPRRARNGEIFSLAETDAPTGKRRQLLLASACLAALAVGFALTPGAALAATVTWTNGAGDNNFNSPTNWSTGIVPVAGDDVVIGAGFTVNVPSGHTINSLTTAAGTIVNDNSNLTINAGTNAGANAGTLNANNNTSLTLTGGFNNTGTVALNSVGNITDLQVNGTLSLTGGGAVTLSNNTANRVYGLGGGSVLDNVNNTISGAGEIGVNGNLSVTNEAAGVIDANQTTAQTLDGGNTITNKGILRATNTGGLNLTGGVVVNNAGGGRLQANGAGAHVDLQSVTIQGGTLSTTGGGLIQTTSVGTLDGSVTPVTISTGSTVQVNNNTTLNLKGAIDAQGVIKLNSVGNVTDLIVGAGTVTLSGPGGIITSDNVGNRIYGGGGGILDNLNSTISGAGSIGVLGGWTLKNESLIDANLTTALVINASVPVLNTGTLRSSNTSGGNGGLVLSGTTIDNTGASNSGLILADGANTHVDINAATTILGGTLTSKNGGVINVSNSTLDGTTAGAPVHVSAGTSVNVANNTSINLKGAIDAQGVIKLNSVGNVTDLIVGAGTVTLSGPGGIITSDNVGNRIYGGGGGILDNLNSTISGAGSIGVLGGWTLKNESLIDANLTTALVINASVPVLNTGTLRSSNTSAGNGGLVLSGTTIDNTGAGNSGLILATGTNAHVDIVSSTILGGTLTGTGGGVFNGNASTLDGTTAGAPVNITAGTTLNYGNNTANTLNGTINNQGTIAQNSVGNITDLIIGAAGAKLTGGGAITLSDSTANRIYSNTAGAVLENFDNIISGAGQIFQNAGLVLKNDTAGVIDATGANALSINTFPGTNPVQNLGLLETTAGAGGLTIGTGATIDNTGNSNAGRIVADGAGTHVDIVSSTILGGTLTGKNGGVLNGSSSTLDGTTAGAPVNITAGTTLNYGNNTTNFLIGTIHNDGTIAQNSAGNITDLLIATGGATLTGGGALVLSDNPANRIYANGAAVLTNVSNTISGAGHIFTNAGLSLVNSGVVDATGNNSLMLGLDITNNPGGTLRGSGAGGLIINSGTTNNQGTVEALNASAVTFNGSAVVANNAGGTLTGGIWRAISTGTGAAITLTGGTIQTNAADIYLAGSGSTLTAGGSSIDTTLATNNGALRIQDGRQFTATGGGGNFVNNGLLELANPTGGSQFKAATSLTNSATGTIAGYGTVANRVANAGTVQAIIGNLAVTGGVTGAGIVSAQTGATVDFSSATAASTAGNLLLAGGGKLALGSQNITVSQDYNNANFGTGNSFNNHANVTGTGQILASGTGLSLSVSGTGITGGGTPTPTLGLGSVHVGSPLGGAFDINWAGTGAPSLRGAVQTTSGLSVSAPGYGPIALGGSAHETVSVAPGAAGSLSGQSLKVVTNFDNVAAKTIAVTGAAYDFANPTILTAQPIAFGNHHVGDAITQQAVSIQNTVVTSAAFQEGLDAKVGGTTGGVTTNGASFTNLAAGAPANASIKVGIDASAAGSKNGNASLQFTSNGSTTSGLAATPLASQNVAVTGSVYNLASSNTIAPINLGVRHVGDGGGSVSVGIGVTNTAPAGLFSEGLDSSFGSYANSGGTLTPTFIGSITNLTAGATDSASLQAKLSTLTAGSVSGNVTIHQASNGTISGLANTGLADQTPSVTGSVSATITNLAQPVINNAQPISFGNVRIGTATTAQTVSVTNGAPVGPFTEGLIGNAVGTTGTGILASGGFGAPGNSLAPGATNPPNPPASGHVSVNIDTTSAGAKSGNALIDFQSDGTAFAGGTVTDLGNTAVAVAGNVYRLANPVQNTSAVSLAARVGDAAPNAGVSLTNASPDVFTEGLKAGFGVLSAGFTGTGAIANLAAGGTDASTLKIGLSTATSGAFFGSAGLTFTSTGAGNTGAADLALPGGSVTLTGKVYQTAVASVTPNPVSFGIVHVGDIVATKSVNVANTAAGALVDVITGGFGTVASPFSGTGTLGAGVASGGNSNALQVGLSTVAAGVFSGTANLALASHDADLADVSLATSVALSGQVNNFAKPAYGKLSGAGSFSGAGLAYKLDFGTVLLGSAMEFSSLEVLNAVLAPADDLSGTFTESGTGLSEFSFTGLTPFTGLVAGGADPFSSDFNPTTNGFFDVFVTLHPTGSNASGFSGALPDVTLELTGTVQPSIVTTPEPAGIALFATALLGLLGILRRNSRA